MEGNRTPAATPTSITGMPFPALNRAAFRRVRSAAARSPKMPAFQASARLREAINDHAREAMKWARGDRQGKAPVLAIRASAGIGKSQAVLEVLAQPEWANARVLYLVPSIELAEELKVRAEEMNIISRVLRGRSQPQPGQPKNGARMCAKHDLADAMAGLGYDIANTLCRSKSKTKGGPDEECEFAATCPYLAQLRHKGPGLLIAAHQYIPLTMEGLKEENIDLLIVDESFWQALCRQGRVSTSQFQLHRMPGEFSKAAFRKGESRETRDERLAGDAADHYDLVSQVRNVLHQAMEESRPLTLSMFREAGLTPEACRWAASYEYGRLGKPDVTAGMPREEQAARIRAAVVDEAYGFARVWKILAAELEQADRDQLIGLVREPRHFNEKTGTFEDVLLTYYHAEPKLTEVPLVLIDADLEERIAERFYPVAGNTIHLEADWQNVRIRQVVDRAVSRNMLAGSNPREDEQKRHGNRREDLWAIAADMAFRHGHPTAFPEQPGHAMAARNRRPLLVTYKGVEDAWISEGRIEGQGEEATPKRNALPFAVAHLGDVRGKDGWKHATGIIVAGRLEPTVDAIEALTRCVFYNAPEPLAFLPRDEHGHARYESEDRAIQMRDGTDVLVPTAIHPDPRCQAVLTQVREAELLQAIARIRPVHRTDANPCEIIVATNIPLPGLMVDEATTWNDLSPDRLRRMAIHGVVPDLAADCAAAYPEMFPSPAAVRQARSRAYRNRLPEGVNIDHAGCDKAHLVSLYGECHTLAGASAPALKGMVRVEFRRSLEVEGGRKGRFRAGSATVRVNEGEDEADVVARLQSVLPDAFAVAVVGPLPCPVEQPEEAAEGLENAVSFLSPWLDTEVVGGAFPKRRVDPLFFAYGGRRQPAPADHPTAH